MDDRPPLTVDVVVKVSCELLGVSHRVMLGGFKGPTYQYARQICVALCRNLTHASLQQIAVAVGFCSHDSVTRTLRLFRTVGDMDAYLMVETHLRARYRVVWLPPDGRRKNSFPACTFGNRL